MIDPGFTITGSIENFREANKTGVVLSHSRFLDFRFDGNDYTNESAGKRQKLRTPELMEVGLSQNQRFSSRLKL